MLRGRSSFWSPFGLVECAFNHISFIRKFISFLLFSKKIFEYKTRCNLVGCSHILDDIQLVLFKKFKNLAALPVPQWEFQANMTQGGKVPTKSWSSPPDSFCANKMIFIAFYELFFNFAPGVLAFNFCYDFWLKCWAIFA